jgi:hypothetical protein
MMPGERDTKACREKNGFSSGNAYPDWIPNVRSPLEDKTALFVF